MSSWKHGLSVRVVVASNIHHGWFALGLSLGSQKLLQQAEGRVKILRLELRFWALPQSHAFSQLSRSCAHVYVRIRK